MPKGPSPWRPVSNVFDRNPLLGYMLAIALSAFAIAVQLALKIALSVAVFIVFYPAVFMTALIAGFGPALVVIGVGIASAFAIFAPASGTVGAISQTLTRVSVFASMATLISWIVARGTQAQKRALRDLDFERRRLDAVLNQMPVGVIIAEAPSGRVLISNDQVEKILCRPVSRLENVPFHRAMTEFSFHRDNSSYDPSRSPLARSIFHGEIITNEELAVVGSDGHCRTISVYSGPIKDSSGAIQAAVMAFVDISHQKMAERELERAVRDREDIMAILGHDLKNPLSSIDLNASLLLRSDHLDREFIFGRMKAIQKFCRQGPPDDLGSTGRESDRGWAF